MNTHYTYLFIDIAILLIPVLVSIIGKAQIHRSLPALIAIGYCYVLCDSYLLQWGVLAVNPEFVLSGRVSGLPIERWLFYIVTGYAGVFIYNFLITHTHHPEKPDAGPGIMLVVGIALVDLGIFYRHKAYTLTSFELSGIACILGYVFRKRFKRFRGDIFIFTFLVGLIPFLIVDGVLTYLPAVVYGSAKITGIHLVTIPIEDIFYGVPLLLLNILVVSERRSRVIV